MITKRERYPEIVVVLAHHRIGIADVVHDDLEGPLDQLFASFN